MNLKYFYILSYLLMFCISSKGQVTATIKDSPPDSVQIRQINKVSNDIIFFEILEIQGQIINNLNYMVDYLYDNQKRTQAKLDSILNTLPKESKRKQRKKKMKSKRD